uniref:Poly [ADP-ribose] polymerase n=1 Tax=Hirondellea gigas TaxID=1518452 RepID=A0A6A7G5E3_9CRUS
MSRNAPRNRSSNRSRGRSSNPRTVRSRSSSAYGNMGSPSGVGFNQLPPGGPYYTQQQRMPYQQPFGAVPSQQQNNHARGAVQGAAGNDLVHVTFTRSQFEKLTIGSRASREASSSSGVGMTVWFNHLEGDVEIPEICVFSIANTCKFKESGCKRLHAKCPLQWQFKNNDSWYNFREFHSKELEEAFQRPERDGVRLSAIDQERLQADKTFMNLQKLLGKHSWTADFDKMVIEEGVNSQDIRRISTHSSVMSKSKMATVYEWYVKDECDDNWIKYGQVNTANKADCVPNITSDELEIQFTREKVAAIDFESEKHQYTLDFDKMLQTNKNTGVTRPVRRRTKIRPIKGAYYTCKAVSDSTLPKYWAAMDSKNIFNLFVLKASDPEYVTNTVLMKKTLPNCNIIEIKRIQNPYLWNAYVNKKKYIEKKNNSGAVREQYLFHGTDAGNLSSICEQNLDWRLHGSNVGQRYGRGSYFSHSAQFSDHYSSVRGNSKVLLIVKVLIGTITLGHPLLTRPPKDSATGNLFDTTVDNIISPRVFVKYDNQEYYPEYIVEYH